MRSLVMFINKQSYTRQRAIRKALIIGILLSIVSTYAAFIPLQSTSIVVSLNGIHRNVLFTSEKVYLLNGTAYDFYSIDELNNHSRPGLQWRTFPLPDDQILPNITPWTPTHQRQMNIPFVQSSASSTIITGLAFVDHIYVTSIPNLTDRHANIERMLAQHQMTNYEWWMKWTRETCNAPENREEVMRKLNLMGPNQLNTQKAKRMCSLTMKHVDIWHDIVTRNSSLSLILEDDAVFVPNFSEKFNRTIYTAIRTGALKIGGLSQCMMNKSRLSADSEEWLEQDPMIVIGSCMQFHDNAFAKHLRDASPMLSTHKQDASRCAHAYLLTACSAAALLRQIGVRKRTFVQSDILLNAQVVASPTLQSFWLDPSIAYQGNRIIDLDGIPSFKGTTY